MRREAGLDFLQLRRALKLSIASWHIGRIVGQWTAGPATEERHSLIATHRRQKQEEEGRACLYIHVTIVEDRTYRREKPKPQKKMGRRERKREGKEMREGFRKAGYQTPLIFK